MTKFICFAAIAAVALCAVPTPAGAAKKGAANRPGLTAVQRECFQKYAAYDPATKRYVIRVPYYHMASKMDAIENCVAERTGKRPAKFIGERTAYPR